MRALGIAADHARLGLCPGTLIAGVDPELLIELDFVRGRYRMCIRERQQIKALQLPVHLRQLAIATNQLFNGLPGRGAIEAGVEGSRGRRGICTKTHGSPGADREEGSQKWRDHFHFDTIIRSHWVYRSVRQCSKPATPAEQSKNDSRTQSSSRTVATSSALTFTVAPEISSNS
ncbi:hypothetical protein D3C80_1445370 [compost metagenome]